jgi:hypothetical protein
MTHDVVNGERPGRKVRYRCSARTQTNRPCLGAVPAPGCRCARHSGAISTAATPVFPFSSLSCSGVPVRLSLA